MLRTFCTDSTDTSEGEAIVKIVADRLGAADQSPHTVLTEGRVIIRKRVE